MKKKIVIATMLAALTAVPVFAATVDQVQPQNDWFNQMMGNHRQMMQSAIDNGMMTTDQVTRMNEYMQQMMGNSGMMHNGGMMGNSGMMHNGGMMGNGNMIGNNGMIHNGGMMGSIR